MKRPLFWFTIWNLFSSLNLPLALFVGSVCLVLYPYHLLFKTWLLILVQGSLFLFHKLSYLSIIAEIFKRSSESFFHIYLPMNPLFCYWCSLVSKPWKVKGWRLAELQRKQDVSQGKPWYRMMHFLCQSEKSYYFQRWQYLRERTRNMSALSDLVGCAGVLRAGVSN